MKNFLQKLKYEWRYMVWFWTYPLRIKYSLDSEGSRNWEIACDRHEAKMPLKD